MNLPNKITLTRIFMIPVFVLFFYLDVMNGWNYLVAAIVFVLAASTDALDGHIARSRGLVTNLGKFLDPIADKVLVSTALILLLTRGWAFEVDFFAGWGLIVAGICVAVILARELIVSGFRMIAAGRGIVLAADKLGKIKTVFQDLSIALILAGMAFVGSRGGEIVVIIGIFCFFICTALTVISGVNYIVRNKQVLSEEAQA
ncbi:MAG TPA: CDP-diacylglycerol--glycerol-3-phosphate 3-phosphatidyltransferase [Firmicutes bacterium]|nr:CDP-diacylglycerol--glycerol-3-phosphate 3-phosphatidyltransferase [Bacillota bacterium]